MTMRKKKKLVWTPRALGSLRAIRNYIAREAPRTAAAFVARLRRHPNRLRMFPELGGRIEEDNPYDLREIIYRDYRLVYHYDGKTVFIVDVFHGRYPLRLDDITFE